MSNLAIKVLNKAAEPFESTWEGVTRQRVKQWCLLEVDGLPTAFQITVDPGKEHQPGDYTIAPESFSVTNGRLTMSRVVLLPVAAAAAKPKAA